VGCDHRPVVYLARRTDSVSTYGTNLVPSITAPASIGGRPIAAQNARIAALEARLNELTRPPGTPGNDRRRCKQGRSVRAERWRRCSEKHWP
jgi:hypothetical protein